MNWDAIGAIGEVVGAAAVVVTLLFLITLLRQNTKSLNESRAANISHLDQFRAQMHMDGMLRKAEAFGLILPRVMERMRDEGIDALSPAERMFLISHATVDAVRLDNGVFQHECGFLHDDYVAYFRKSIRHFAPCWDQIGLFELSTFRQGFIDEVQRLRAADD